MKYCNGEQPQKLQRARDDVHFLSQEDVHFFDVLGVVDTICTLCKRATRRKRLS